VPFAARAQQPSSPPAVPPVPFNCSDAGAHPEFRQLDFWLGDWEVFNGENKISEVHVGKVLNDCALQENWHGLRGGDGLGVSTYNQKTKEWEYFWVSARGATSHFTGSLLPQEMRFRIRQPLPTGGTRMRHWSLIQLPGGKVREFSVGSNDDGATWTTEYDYTWVPKKS
jgi:hypothetical protein